MQTRSYNATPAPAHPSVATAHPVLILFEAT